MLTTTKPGRVALGFLIGLAAAMAHAEVVDVNTASVEELASLENIGEQRARAIIDYREAQGPFATLEELTEVEGVGARSLEINRERLTIGE